MSPRAATRCHALAAQDLRGVAARFLFWPPQHCMVGSEGQVAGRRPRVSFGPLIHGVAYPEGNANGRAFDQLATAAMSACSRPSVRPVSDPGNGEQAWIRSSFPGLVSCLTCSRSSGKTPTARNHLAKRARRPMAQSPEARRHALAKAGTKRVEGRTLRRVLHLPVASDCLPDQTTALSH